MMNGQRVLSYHGVRFSVGHLSTNRGRGLRLDKSPSPRKSQPIGMGWLLARWPVGSRAAFPQSSSDYNDDFGTGRILPSWSMRP